MALTGAQKTQKERQKKIEKEQRQNDRMREAKGLPRGAEIARLKAQASDNKFQKLLHKASLLRIPAEVKLDVLKTSNPALYAFVTNGDAKVKKGQDAIVNRVIWYNELDKNYTFSSHFPICRANFKLMAHHFAENTFDQASHILRDYYIAYSTDPDFTRRDNFLKHWQSSNDDIEYFTQSETKGFDDFASGLLSALPSADDTTVEQERRAEHGNKDGEDITMQDPEDIATKLGGLTLLNAEDAAFRSRSEWVKSTIRAMNARVQELYDRLAPSVYEFDNATNEKYKHYIKTVLGFQEEVTKKNEKMKRELAEFTGHSDDDSETPFL